MATLGSPFPNVQISNVLPPSLGSENMVSVLRAHDCVPPPDPRRQWWWSYGLRSAAQCEAALRGEWNDSGRGPSARPPTVSITEVGHSPQPWTKPTLRSGNTHSTAISECLPFQNKEMIWETMVHYGNKQVIMLNDCISFLSLLQQITTK